MSNAGRYIRAFRPSKYGRHEECDEEAERAKQANLQRYAERAEAGIPLFDSPAAVTEFGLKLR